MSACEQVDTVSGSWVFVFTVEFNPTEKGMKKQSKSTYVVSNLFEIVSALTVVVGDGFWFFGRLSFEFDPSPQPTPHTYRIVSTYLRPGHHISSERNNATIR